MGSQGGVYHVMFSPTNPQHILSVADGKIWHWNINGHQTSPPYNCLSIALSSDGTQFAQYQGEDVIVQNSSSGAVVAKFHVANSGTEYYCFSPDSRFIAGAAGHTAYVWDTTRSHPHLIDTFIGHTEIITSLVFSSPSSLISSSRDKSVKFWQVGALQTDPVGTDTEHTPVPSAQIKSITVQAEDGVVISSDSEGVVRVWDISTGHCKTSFQTPAKGSQCGNVRLINSMLILIWYVGGGIHAWDVGGEIHIWDVEKGELIQTVAVNHHHDFVRDVRISGDGSQVFFLCWWAIRAWSVLAGEVVGEVGLDYDRKYISLSVHGSSVWAHSPISEPLGWDFRIPGSPLVQLSNPPSPHSNKSKLWHIGQSGIIDTVTGKMVFQLAGKFAKPTDLQWDGQYLAAGFESGDVLILDFNHMPL